MDINQKELASGFGGEASIKRMDHEKNLATAS